jgi:MOSC domain-containing protein YiiM
MLNLNPDTGVADPRLMKAAVRLNENCTGVYAMVIRTGTVRVGEPLYLE